MNRVGGILLTLFSFTAAAQYPGQQAVDQKVSVQAPIKAYSFDLRDVRLLAGPFKDNMVREGQWMLSLPVNRLLHSFRVNAGMSTVDKSSLSKMPQPLGGWESLDMELRGHSIGHLLSGLALQYASTGDEAFRLKADSLVRGLVEVQRVLNQDGYLSAFPQEYINRNIAGMPVWAPWYTLHKLVAGLLDQYTYTGNQHALDIAVGMGHWASKKLDTLPPAMLQRMLRNEFGGMNEAWYNLYALTGDTTFRHLGDLFYHATSLDPLAAGTDDLPGLHANTLIPKINGEAREYELTGNTQAEHVVKYFWDDVLRNQTFAIGSNSDKEHFFKAGAISQHLTGYTGESCNTYNMLKVTRHLFSWTGEERYAEYYEQALYNHILGQQDPESGMVCYFTPLRPGAYKLYSTRDSSFWCCVGTGFESHSKYGEAIYYHDGKGVFVNLFIPSVLNWRQKGIRLRQETAFPETSATKLILDSVSDQPCALYIRYPAWATGGAELTINGKNVPVHQQPGSYIRLLRKWRTGDQVSINYPMQLRWIPAPDNPAVAAIAYGPIVLAGDMGTEAMPRPFHDPRDPYEYYTYDYHIPATIQPTMPVQNRPLSECLQPAGKPLEFHTSAGLPSITFRPYYQLHRQRTVVYWDRKTDHTDSAAALARVWQWSVPVEGGRSNANARAWLWIPPSCKEIKAVLVTQNNMEEISIVENARFREKMAALGIAAIWVSPLFDNAFRFTEGAGDVFTSMMKDLADASGYDELKNAPVIGLGHSAAASWPYYFAAWAPGRTLACISVSGQWPYVRSPQFSPDIWGAKNIDYIPSLETMGEYEAAESWATEGLKERQAHPAMPLSMLACPAEGHFAASQKKIDYIALYIRKAMQYRLPLKAGQPLRPIDPQHSGWLMERWRRDSVSTIDAAPISQYKGNPADAFWFFDEEMVQATALYQAAYRGLQVPLLGYVQDNDTVKQRNTHLQVEMQWRPLADGVSFVIHPCFLDTVPGGSPRPAMWTGLPVGSKVTHPADAATINIRRVCGPFRQIDDTLFRLDWEKETSPAKPLMLTFAAVSTADARFRPAVQQAEMSVPAALNEGASQKIDFPIIDDLPVSTRSIALNAVSDAGLPVSYYILEGPAIIHDGRLWLQPLPPRTRFPVKVTVVAWQYGRSIEPKVKTADPVSRIFYLRVK